MDQTKKRKKTAEKIPNMIAEFEISGMTCDHCAASIEKLFDEKEGIKNRIVSYSKGMGSFSYDTALTSEEEISDIINSTGSYKVEKKLSEKSSSSDRYNLIVIGGGSAAFSAVLKANALKKSVLMVNSGLPLGGTCVNVGCVPSKNLIRAGETLHKSGNNPFPGIETKGHVTDFKALIKQKRDLVMDLRNEKYINVVKDMEDFHQIEGFAKVLFPDSVEVNGNTYISDHILIATGAKPQIPDIEGLSNVPYLDNESAFELEKLPESIIILGGRYIALETAQMFSRLGSKVTILQRSERILPSEASDLTEGLTEFFIDEGIEVVTGNNFKKVSEKNGRIVVDSLIKGELKTFKSETIIVATGRIPNTENMGLEEVGVVLDKKGFILVDKFLQTSVPSISAAGDVIGEHMFVYTAAYEGNLAVSNTLSGKRKKRDYRALPWVIFTDPQIAGVGIDEKEAFENGIEFDVSVLPLTHVPRSIAARDTRGFIKLIRNKKNDQLIGARILASEGSELLMEIAIAIRYGIKVSDIRDMFHPYLTHSEGIKLAMIGFDKDINTLSCCAT